MDYRNNPRTDRNRFLAFLEKFVSDYFENNKPHKEDVCIIVPEIDLSRDSLDLYKSYSGFLSANRRKILKDSSRIQYPFGMVIQLEIDYEARVHMSYVDNSY